MINGKRHHPSELDCSFRLVTDRTHSFLRYQLFSELFRREIES